MVSLLLFCDCVWKAREGHEHATSVLLRRNADVTVVDDSGRTPLDLARNKRIQAILRDAWNLSSRQKLEDAGSAQEAPASTFVEPPLTGATVECAKPPLRSVGANTPRLRSAKSFERSRSLDQPEHGDVNTISSVCHPLLNELICAPWIDI